MAIAKSILNKGENLAWIELEDSDGGLCKYHRGAEAPQSAEIHVFVSHKLWQLLPAQDGRPILRQDKPGLPPKFNAHVDGLYHTGPALGMAHEILAEGIYVYNQE